MNTKSPTGWMMMGLRSHICSQCRPVPDSTDPLELLSPHPCEGNCALFVQLPRLARFLDRYRAKPPVGYEEFVMKLLCDSAAEFPGYTRSSGPGEPSSPFLDYAPEALAILERIAELIGTPTAAIPQHDCLRESLALGQMGVKGLSDAIG